MNQKFVKECLVHRERQEQAMNPARMITSDEAFLETVADAILARDARIAALVESLKELLPHATRAIVDMNKAKTGEFVQYTDLALIERAEKLITENTIKHY